MNIIFTSRGPEMTQSMKDYVDKIILKFESSLKKVATIYFEYTNESQHKGKEKDMMVKIHFNCKGKFIEAVKEGKDFYVLVDELEPILRKQLEKLKKKPPLNNLTNLL